MHNRCRCPPENSCGYRWRCSGSRPTSSNKLSRTVTTVERSAADPMHAHRFRDHGFYGHAGIERTIRVLKNDLHPTSLSTQFGSVQTGPVCSVEQYGPAADGEQPQDRATGRCLTATGLTDESKSLALVDIEADTIDGSVVVDDGDAANLF